MGGDFSSNSGKRLISCSSELPGCGCSFGKINRNLSPISVVIART
jgi:hypothetical protein